MLDRHQTILAIGKLVQNRLLLVLILLVMVSREVQTPIDEEARMTIKRGIAEGAERAMLRDFDRGAETTIHRAMIKDIVTIRDLHNHTLIEIPIPIPEIHTNSMGRAIRDSPLHEDHPWQENMELDGLKLRTQLTLHQSVITGILLVLKHLVQTCLLSPVALATVLSPLGLV